MNKLIVPILLTGLLLSCTSQTSSSDNATSNLPPMNRKEKLRFNQYKVKGMELYKTHCAACHQPTGEGLESLYPPLKNSDYLLADLGRAACGIKNGQTEQLTVNGRVYSQMMPGFDQLTALEIAEIITYITNEWGNQKGLTDVKQVEEWLKGCS